MKKPAEQTTDTLWQSGEQWHECQNTHSTTQIHENGSHVGGRRWKGRETTGRVRYSRMFKAHEYPLAKERAQEYSNNRP